MSLSESWHPRLILQSFCSQGSSVCVLNLKRRRPLSSEEEGDGDKVSVCLTLDGDALCAARLPDANKEETNERRVEAFSNSASSEAALPEYLSRASSGACRLTDPEIEEGVCAFAACSKASKVRSGLAQKGEEDASCDEAFVLTCGASGLLRLRLLRLREENEDATLVDSTKFQSKDASLRIAAQRLLSEDQGRKTSDSAPRRAWLDLRELQKWRGPASVARVVRFSPSFALGSCDKEEEKEEGDKEEGEKEEGEKEEGEKEEGDSQVRLVAVGFVGGEVEVFVISEKGCSSVVSLKVPCAVTTMEFHSSRALLAVGCSEGQVVVMDLTNAVLRSLESGGASSPDSAVSVELKDHFSAVSALLFLEDEAAQRLFSSRDSSSSPVVLLSAAGDSLLNAWKLSSFFNKTGLFMQAGGRLPEVRPRKQCLALQRKLAQESWKPFFSIPMLEHVTVLFMPDSTSPLFLTGGSEGVLKVWDLRTRKLVQVRQAEEKEREQKQSEEEQQLPRDAVLSVQKELSACALPSSNRKESDGLKEDLGLYIRSLKLLPSSTAMKAMDQKRLLMAQDSGLLTIATFKMDKEAVAFAGDPVCLLGRLDDVFACRFLPPPPEDCRCPCCEERRREAATCSAEQLSLTAGYPSALVVLIGDSVAWRVKLRNAFVCTPVGACRSSIGGSASSLRGHSAAVTCVDVSKNGCWIVTGSRDGSLCVWHSSLNRLIFKVEEAHSSCLTAVAFQRKKWENASPLFLEEGTEGRQCRCDCRGLSPSNAFQLTVASACDSHNVKLWRFRVPSDLFSLETNAVAQGEVLASVVAHKKEINDLQFAPNDSMICTASQDRTVKVLSLPSLADLAELRGHRRAVYSLQFATREKILATVSGDCSIRLWNLDSFTCVKTLQGTGAGLLCVRFLNLDSQLLTADSEGLVQLWNCRTSECVGTMQPLHQDKVWCMDTWGQALVTGGADGQLCVWKDVSEEVRVERRRGALREQQEMAVVKALEGTDRVAEVFSMLLRMKKKFALVEFLKRRFSRGLVEALDRDNPAACIRRRSVQTLLSHFLPSDLQNSPLRSRAVLAKLGLPAESSVLEREKEEEEEFLWSRAVAALEVSQARTLLGFVVDWSGDPSTSWLAQGMLHLMLQSFSLDDLAGEGVSSLGSKPTADVIEALMAFAERQERRVSGLLQKSFLLDLLRPGAASVQQEVEEMVSALDPKKNETFRATSGQAPKKRKVGKASFRGQQGETKSPEASDLSPEKKIVSSDFLARHFGSAFTEQCLYGDA